jgi:ureidoglycolate lyase
MTRLLRLEPLTAAGFSPFGDVIDPPAIGARVGLLESLFSSSDARTPRLSFNHAVSWTLPLRATEMERHNHSSQCFVPMDVERWVLLVAPNVNGKPDAMALRGFVARGDQAVNYHVGTWHHPLRALDRPGRFASLMWTTGQRTDDEEWSTLPEPVELDV